MQTSGTEYYSTQQSTQPPSSVEEGEEVDQPAPAGPPPLIMPWNGQPIQPLDAGIGPLTLPANHRYKVMRLELVGSCLGHPRGYLHKKAVEYEQALPRQPSRRYRRVANRLLEKEMGRLGTHMFHAFDLPFESSDPVRDLIWVYMLARHEMVADIVVFMRMLRCKFPQEHCETESCDGIWTPSVCHTSTGFVLSQACSQHPDFCRNMRNMPWRMAQFLAPAQNLLDMIARIDAIFRRLGLRVSLDDPIPSMTWREDEEKRSGMPLLLNASILTPEHWAVISEVVPYETNFQLEGFIRLLQ
jgi:hypothetical protein